MAASDVTVHLRLGSEDVTALLAWMQTCETVLAHLADRLPIGWDKDHALELIAELASLRLTPPTTKVAD